MGEGFWYRWSTRCQYTSLRRPWNLWETRFCLITRASPQFTRSPACSTYQCGTGKGVRPKRKLGDGKPGDAPPPPLPPKPNEPPKPKPILRTRTTRVYPTQAQRGVLRNWFGGHRFIYNACVAFYKHTQATEKREEEENVKKRKVHFLLYGYYAPISTVW